MSQPRTADEVHAERVADAEQAVVQAQQADAEQQGQAQAWLNNGVPANTGAHRPGAHQHD